MARIKVVTENESTGELREVYDDLLQKRGRLSNVLTVQSLHPKKHQQPCKLLHGYYVR